MQQRLTLTLAATALAVALLGATPLGQAATHALAKAVPLALNANKLNGHASSVIPKPGQIPVVGPTGTLSTTILPAEAGVTGYLQILQQVSVPANATNNITDMSCPTGKVILSGGFNADSTTGESVFASHPMVSNNTGWEFRARNPSGSTIALTNYYIVCGNGTP